MPPHGKRSGGLKWIPILTALLGVAIGIFLANSNRFPFGNSNSRPLRQPSNAGTGDKPAKPVDSPTPATEPNDKTPARVATNPALAEMKTPIDPAVVEGAKVSQTMARTDEARVKTDLAISEQKVAVNSEVAPAMGPLMPGINLNGSDFGPTPQTAQSAAQCSDMCRLDSKCNAMTFVPPNSCWLKTAVPLSTNVSGMTSAIKAQR